MITAVDTNVLIGLWNADDSLNALARSSVDAALACSTLVISAPVFAELLATPSKTEAFLDYFLKETGIIVDWELKESDWRTAGRAFQSYAGRRRKHGDVGPRRFLTDFLIGAHALRRGHRLLTLDDRLYRAAFPRLSIIAV